MRAIIKSFYYVVLVCMFLGLGTGCSRPNQSETTSVITINTPVKSELLEKVKALSETLPADKTYCFAVSVKGPGIAETTGVANMCQSTVGIYSGFVEQGSALTLEVPKGAGRNFELFLYLAEPGAICPALSSSFFSSADAYLKTYQVGKTLNVNLSLADESVGINLDYRGIAQNLIADSGRTSCVDEASPPPAETLPAHLRAMLYSDGSIVEAGVDTSILSKSWIESFFTLLVETFSLSSLEAIGSAHNSVQDLMTAGGVSLPAFLRSFSTDPATGDLYALAEGGDIYKVNKADGSLVDFTCPFSSCQLPSWVESISVGLQGKLFALDHAGQIYELEATGLNLLTDAVAPSVVQVLYY